MLGASAATDAAHGPVSSSIKVHFIRTSSASLQSLISGGFGSGILLYYRVNTGWTHPLIEVKLVHRKSSAAEAYVYDRVRPGRAQVIKSELFAAKPVLSIAALQDWWVRRGIPDYNLKIKVFGPMYAMWGGPTYPTPIRPGQLLAKIWTHANSKGIPVWDFRQLVPQFPGDGVYRSNYAQRTGPGPLQFLPSVSPLWPYVAQSGGFTQPNGKLNPPIVVNWVTGKVVDFSEVVTVREQNNSYDFYSLTPIKIGAVNHPDFEAPWGFYDLSGKGQGYPNLIIRNEHYFANDPWYHVGTSRIPKPNEVIRYTWADHPGNNYFNYKVDVFGFHPYTTRIPIMNGHTWVVAPAYRSYPKWVVDHRWPATTFVDTNGKGYATSEGIYQWSSRVSLRYLTGWTTHPNVSAFQSIPLDSRGEYRVGAAHRPRLYISAIDRRPHLLYARAGLWNLGKGWMLREVNQHGGPYLNLWQLWYSKPLGRRIHKKIAPSKKVAQLAAAHGYVVDAGPRGVEIVRMASSKPVLAVLTPPTNHATWMQFKQTVHAFGIRKNPMNLAIWANSITGARLSLAGDHVHDLQITSTALEFVLQTTKDQRIAGSVRKVLGGLTLPSSAGTWVVNYSTLNHRWMATKGTVPKLIASIKSTKRIPSLFPTKFLVRLTNQGTEPWRGRIRVMVGRTVIGSQTEWVEGRSHSTWGITWNPLKSGQRDIKIFAGKRVIGQSDVEVKNTGRGPATTLWAISLPGVPDTELTIVLLFALVVIGGGITVWRRLL